MRNDLDHDAVLDSLHAYVLGTLEPEEMQAMDAYIEQQRRLLAELERAEETTTYLAQGAPDVPLPPAIKERLMARVYADLAEREESEARPPAPAPPVPSPTAQPDAAPAPEGSHIAGGGRAGSLRFWRPAALLATAAVLVMLLYTGQARQSLSATRSMLDSAQEEITALRQANSRLEESNAELQQELAGFQQRLAVLATAQQATLLPGTGEAPDAHGAFYRSGENGLLIWSGLEPLPSEQTYQLWLIPVEGDPVSAGLVPVDDSGSNLLELTMPEGVEDYAAVGVSVEPGGGSLAPTGTIVLLGENSPPPGES